LVYGKNPMLSCQCNAAYSLYGVLSGDNSKGCNRDTYINSFFTTEGVEAFTSAFGYVGVQNDSRRHLEDGDDADEGENDADNEDGDDVTQEEEEGDLEDVEEDDGDANQEEENGEDDNQDDAIEDEDEGDNENYAADDTDDANENDDDDSA